MGLSPFGGKYDQPWVSATETPKASVNPDPQKWVLYDSIEFKGGYVLKVHYPDCTNYEGMKIIVFKGRYVHHAKLDPHFSPDDPALFARFQPTAEGWIAACQLAASFPA